MTKPEELEESKPRSIPDTKNKKTETKNKGSETKKKREFKLGKIFQRPHKKLPRSIKPPNQSPFFPNLAFLTNIQTNQYNRKVTENFTSFKKAVAATDYSGPGGSASDIVPS